MSRSYCTYNEDWQRRKSILIRSLFHDIPILSPVPEESTESVLLNPTDAITDTCHHLIEDDDRPESPLPPLIIERAPNRHDEPEEYYEQLLKKIKRIYKKLFIENRDLSPEDLNSIPSDNSMNEVNFGITAGDFNNVSVDVNIAFNDEEDNGNVDSTDNNGESSNSFNSNGYVADLESSSTVEWIDVENFKNSNENIRHEEEEEVTNDDDDEGVYDIENDNDVGNGRLINEIAAANNESNYPDLMEIEEELNHSINDEKTCESENSNRIKVDEEEYSKSPDFCDNIIEETELNDDVLNNNNNFEVYYQDKNGKSSIVETNQKESELISHFKELEEDADKTSSIIDDYRQITTQALVHVDGCRDPIETESRVYEDSIKSIILPARHIPIMIDVRRIDVDDEIQKLSLPEDNEDTDTTTLESYERDLDTEPIEVMRTPHPRTSHKSIPITTPSEAEITLEYTGLPDNTSPVNITSFQEDSEEKNISEAKTSNEINNLTFILSKSQNEVANSPVARKRKLHEDAAVQTSQKVAWDELRGNFFVGTPKVFRLCACVEHICRNR